eukprot:3468195-Amphidinium_carterae.1
MAAICSRSIMIAGPRVTWSTALREGNITKAIHSASTSGALHWVSSKQLPSNWKGPPPQKNKGSFGPVPHPPPWERTQKTKESCPTQH